MMMNRAPLADVIDTLRATAARRGNTASVAHLRTLVDDLQAIQPPWVTLARPGFAGWEEDDLFDLISNFGSHLARSRKVTADKVETVICASDSEEQVLLIIPRDILDEQQALLYAKCGNNLKLLSRRERHALIEIQAMTYARMAVLPDGYADRGAGRKNRSRSISAAVYYTVTDAEVIRFIARASRPGPALCIDHLHLLQWFSAHDVTDMLLGFAGARVDETGEIEQVPGKDTHPGLCAALAHAYDLMETYRVAAVAALAAICTTRPGPDTLADYRQALETAQWLVPAELTRLTRLVDTVAADLGNQRLWDILASRTASFAASAKAAGRSWAPASVGDMSVAHLLHITALAGLVTDTVEHDRARNTIRTRLVEMGLARDLDQELGEGLRAWATGHLEEFYTSREARLAGDPDWDDLYVAQSASLVV